MDEKLWLNWAIELQSLAQAGMTYGKDIYDRERYERIREISAEIIAHKSEILGIVQGEMLKRNTYTATFYTADVSRGHFSRKIWVLGKVFEISSAERISLYIGPGTKQKIDLIIFTLLSYGFTHFFYHLGIEAAGAE